MRHGAQLLHPQQPSPKGQTGHRLPMLRGARHPVISPYYAEFIRKNIFFIIWVLTHKFLLFSNNLAITRLGGSGWKKKHVFCRQLGGRAGEEVVSDRWRGPLKVTAQCS